MSDQYFQERTNNPVDSGITNQQKDNPVLSDPLTDRVTTDAPLIQEKPTVENFAYQTPDDDTLAYKVPLKEQVPSLPYKDVEEKTTADDSQTNKSVPYKASVPLGETTTQAVPVATRSGSSTALLTGEESEHFRSRWNEIQATFVDEPRSAVQQADRLVSEVVETITKMFASEHSALEVQWRQGNDVSTEDLRKALQHYRSFFNRLVV